MTVRACGARPGAKPIAPGVDSNSLAFFQIPSTIPWGTDSPVSWTSMEVVDYQHHLACHSQVVTWSGMFPPLSLSGKLFVARTSD